MKSIRDIIRDRVILDEAAIVADADGYGIVADDILRDLREAGYMVVPRKCTRAMAMAGAHYEHHGTRGPSYASLERAWPHMLAASIPPDTSQS